MTEQQTLELLEGRLKKLEQKMYGSAPREGNYPEVVSTLSDLSTKLGNALSSRDRMTAVMKRLDDLDEYLDPCYGSGVSQMSEGALTELLLAQQDDWQMKHQQLQQLTQLKPVLDSKPIKDCVGESDRLVELVYKQSELEEQEQQQAERVTSLLHSYNSIIQTLTETFVKMDDIVTRAEVAAQPKKVLD